MGSTIEELCFSSISWLRSYVSIISSVAGDGMRRQGVDLRMRRQGVDLRRGARKLTLTLDVRHYFLGDAT
jgi:hypothetical protein